MPDPSADPALVWQLRPAYRSLRAQHHLVIERGRPAADSGDRRLHDNTFNGDHGNYGVLIEVRHERRRAREILQQTTATGTTFCPNLRSHSRMSWSRSA